MELKYLDQLRIVYDIETDLENALVPSLLFQSLVENALKYGIDPKKFWPSPWQLVSIAMGKGFIRPERVPGDLVSIQKLLQHVLPGSNRRSHCKNGFLFKVRRG